MTPTESGFFTQVVIYFFFKHFRNYYFFYQQVICLIFKEVVKILAILYSDKVSLVIGDGPEPPLCLKSLTDYKDKTETHWSRPLLGQSVLSPLFGMS